ncbi:MAG TPA: TIGR02391 family protein, partial [Puia sp.]|nr:TIGR02391 family protein [Puia sp.]
HIQDTDPGITKWKRLYNAFTRSQKKHQCSNQVLQFLTAAMQPSRYFGKQEFFITRLNELNKRLSFIGISMTESAKFLIVEKAQTLSEAQQRASHFRYKLEIRNVHSDVFKYCGEELLQENFFHAVFEGVKSIADRLRGMTGIYADGNALIDIAFSTTTPLVRINLLQNETERSEHVGLSNMIKGLFGLIRNPTAHRPKIKFIIEEEEALDIMTLISFTHKKLDKAL